jgi:hypothetical protein
MYVLLRALLELALKFGPRISIKQATRGSSRDLSALYVHGRDDTFCFQSAADLRISSGGCCTGPGEEELEASSSNCTGGRQMSVLLT